MLWVFLAGASLAGAGIHLAACDDSATTPGVVTRRDSSVADTGEEEEEQDSGTLPKSDSGPGKVDSGPECGTPPRLDDPVKDGIYCPFLTDGGTGRCATVVDGGAVDKCCSNPGSNKNTCTPVADDCATGGLAFECAKAADCPGNEGVCCLTKGDGGATVNRDNACGTNFVSRAAGTHCAQTTCPSGEAKLCGKDSDCQGGTCEPLSVRGIRGVGVCK